MTAKMKQNRSHNNSMCIYVFFFLKNINTNSIVPQNDTSYEHNFSCQ